MLTFTLGRTNCYLLKWGEGYVMIDTSFPGFYEEFLEGLKSEGISPREITHLLLTHHHDDHAGFAARLKRESGCRIIVHRKGVEYLAAGTIGSKNHFLNKRVALIMKAFNFIKKRDYSIEPVIIGDEDIVIEGERDDLLLKTLGLDGTIVRTPGHSEDSLSVILKDGSAFAGDICMNFLNFCGIRFRPIFLTDMNVVLESWKTIMECGVRRIYPSHGKPFSVEKLKKSYDRYNFLETPEGRRYSQVNE